MDEQIKDNHIESLAPPSYSSSFKNILVTSGVANFAIKTILAPLERWKIISQTQMTYSLRPKKFSGFFDYLQRIPREQGIMSFWRGNMTYCWMQFYQLFFQVFLYDSLQEGMKSYKENYENSIGTTLVENILLPFAASFISLIVLHPLDTYRVRLNMSYHKKPYDAYFNKFRHFYSYTKGQQIDQKGLSVVYRGFFLANLIAVLNFNLFFQLQKVVKSESELLSADVVASFLSVFLLHPLDTVKKIIQLNNMSKPRLLTGYRTAFTYIRDNLPLKMLYNGMTISLVKLGLSFGLFYGLRKAYEGKKEQKEA